MRYSFDGLSGLVTTHFGMNPLSGHLFVFFSKRRDRMKILICVCGNLKVGHFFGNGSRKVGHFARLT
jgi:transposase